MPMQALVVDDDAVNRMYLRVLLAKEGYEVVEAQDGLEAVERFEQRHPDIVFMDVMMPHMDGYEATRRIKALAGDAFVPVIFLTALTHDEAMAPCVEAGGDDFLTKPYNQTILKSKIAALRRIHELHQRVHRQHRELCLLQARRQRDDEIAQRVFASALAGSNAVLARIPHLVRPAGVFSGDMLLAARRPGGGIHLMLGDFTGHGLAAAIGAIPASQVFSAMTVKGFEAHDILEQINDKLRAILPKDMFLAICFVSLDKELRKADIWNGGMPDVLVVGGASGRIERRVPSRHLPLGIAAQLAGLDGFDSLSLTAGDRLFLYSDGLIEARNEAGEEFGDQRLATAIEGVGASPRDIVVAEALEAFCRSTPQDDDISLVEIQCQHEALPTAMSVEPGTVPTITHPDDPAWRWALELRVGGLRDIHLVPIALSQLQKIPGLHAHQAEIGAVLSELYTNALHHGVLQLDAMLNTSEDFERYYRLREERLGQLAGGYIQLQLEYWPQPRGGRLRIEIKDSGSGFDPQPYLKRKLEESRTLSNRGIHLVHALCESLRYSGKGNCAEAVYVWKD